MVDPAETQIVVMNEKKNLHNSDDKVKKGQSLFYSFQSFLNRIKTVKAGSPEK
jgi:hypothetical protein